MNETYLIEFAKRYLRRYQGVVKSLGEGQKPPHVAAALWCPSAPHHPFVGVSQWFERQLDPSVAFSLDLMRELATRLGVALPGHHGLCAEPVALSKALRWFQRGGHADPLRAVAGGQCLALTIELTGGSRNPNTSTFAYGASFGKAIEACTSCGMLLRAFNITPL